MSSPRDLRRRIKSISGTAQITRAMQMVAASKMRKAQQAAIAAAPFSRLFYRIQRAATTRARDFEHPLLEVRDVRTRAVILIAADKGLCGALNTNVFRLAAQFPTRVDHLHHGRPQSRAVRRAHAATAGRRVQLRRLANVSRGQSHSSVRPRTLLEWRSGRGESRHHALRQHADAGARHHRVPPGGSHQGDDGRRSGIRGSPDG